MFRLYQLYFNKLFVMGVVVRNSKSHQSYEVSKEKGDEGKQLFYTLLKCDV